MNIIILVWRAYTYHTIEGDYCSANCWTGLDHNVRPGVQKSTILFFSYFPLHVTALLVCGWVGVYMHEPEYITTLGFIKVWLNINCIYGLSHLAHAMEGGASCTKQKAMCLIRVY